jgi:uncharacterized protein YbjQ (UPF0145 family)
MKKLFVASAILLSCTFVSQTALAGEPKKQFVMVNEDVGLPVFPYDIKERPYEVVGQVKAGVRKATAFSKSPSQEKIYKELWERAEKLGADAVINASYGDAHVSLMSWGKTNATGTAIRFTGAAATAAPAAPAGQPAATDAAQAQSNQ